MSSAVIVSVVLLTWGVVELAAWWLIRSLGYIPTREFPRVSRSLVAKFVSFDQELGHLPLANGASYDRDITGKAYATKCSYNSARARVSLFDAEDPAFISTFGDSFCQCRGVEDDQTWQRRLEERFGKPVRNYGVGGHGLDQAYLRYLRLRAEPLGETVIFAVSSCTIERIVGVYKHYIEFGNVLGLKPRFRMDVKGGLELIPLPVKDRAALMHLSTRRKFLRNIDENYLGFFRKYCARFPYSVFLFKSRLDFSQAGTRVLLRIFRRPSTFRSWLEIHGVANAELSRQSAYERKNIYFSSLYGKHEELFFQLVRQIAEDCRMDGRLPVLLMLPDYTNVSFMRTNGHYYQQVLSRIRDALDVTVVDTYETFAAADPRSMYLKANFSGHHTPLGNSIVADQIEAALEAQSVSASAN